MLFYFSIIECRGGKLYVRWYIMVCMYRKEKLNDCSLPGGALMFLAAAGFSACPNTPAMLPELLNVCLCWGATFSSATGVGAGAGTGAGATVFLTTAPGPSSWLNEKEDFPPGGA